MTATAAMATYSPGQCTWYVAELASWLPAGMGNAADWLTAAQSKGLTTLPGSATPQAGDVAVWAPNTGGAYGDGHVAMVTGVSNGQVQVTEMNWGAAPGSTSAEYQTDSRSVDPSQISGYIVPPGSASTASTLGWENDIPIIGGVISGVEGAVSAGQLVANLLGDLTDPASYITVAWFVAAGVLAIMGIKLLTGKGPTVINIASQLGAATKGGYSGGAKAGGLAGDAEDVAEVAA